MTWKAWLIGLVNAGISGSTTALLGDFMHLSTKQIGVLALGSFFVSAGKWYLQHPPPGISQ